MFGNELYEAGRECGGRRGGGMGWSPRKSPECAIAASTERRAPTGTEHAHSVATVQGPASAVMHLREPGYRPRIRHVRRSRHGPCRVLCARNGRASGDDGHEAPFDGSHERSLLAQLCCRLTAEGGRPRPESWNV